MNYITEERFEDFDFQNKEIKRGQYEYCVFIRCILKDVDLSKFVFIDCEFIDCDLTNANLDRTSFQNVRFKGSKLVGLRFDHCADFALSFDFVECRLDHASFYRKDIKKTNFFDTQLIEVDFTETNLTESVIKNCDLSRSIFNNTILERADLTSSIGFSIDPEVNKIKKARFSLQEVKGLLVKYNIIIE